MQNIRWGVLGCGGIARNFASSLKSLETGTLEAGASSSQERADDFARETGAAKAYGNYDALVNDSDIDAVYVATTHNFHFENVKLCLQNGKHVLCEKPLTVNAAQARELIELAREQKLFLMEAVWTRFLPAVVKLKALLAEGAIGEVRTIRADFTLYHDFPDDGRMKNPELAGGCLLDLGVYPINFANFVFDARPVKVQGSAYLGETGVDERSFYLLDYPGGRHATLSSSISHQCPAEAVIYGTTGRISIPWFHAAQELQVHLEGQDEEIIKLPYLEGEGFKYEIAHAMECIAAGKLESEVIPLAETLSVMETMDALRAQWGLCYPGE